MRKIFVPVVILAIGCIASIAVRNERAKVSDLTLANIEALSNMSESRCSFNKVEKNEEKHELKCSGKGNQCCTLD